MAALTRATAVSAHSWLAKLPVSATQCLERLALLPMDILKQQVEMVRQQLSVRSASSSSGKRSADQAQASTIFAAKRAKQTINIPVSSTTVDTVAASPESASALSCNSSPTSSATSPSEPDRKSLYNRLVVLKAAIALKAVNEVQHGSTPVASKSSVLQQRLQMLQAERQQLKTMLLEFEARYNAACSSQQLMLTVEAHQQWELRYQEYDNIKQLIADTQAQLDNQAPQASQVQTELSSMSVVNNATLAPTSSQFPTMHYPRAIVATTTAL